MLLAMTTRGGSRVENGGKCAGRRRRIFVAQHLKQEADPEKRRAYSYDCGRTDQCGINGAIRRTRLQQPEE